MTTEDTRKMLAEIRGTAFRLTAVNGSGIVAERLPTGSMLSSFFATHRRSARW